MEHGTGIKELELVNIEWQVHHHLAKQSYRQKIVDDLNLQPGGWVLDLGCGPGLWSSMFANKITPDGRVIGIDLDSRWIEYASQNLEQNPLKDIIEYRIDDINNLSFADKTFDLVFISGCSPYFANIHSVLEKQKRVLKEGGKLVDRSWDDGMFITHPVSPYLSAKVRLAIAQAFEERDSKNYFDNYFGRKSHNIFKQIGLRDVSTTSYAVQLLAPLSLAEKQYIIGNMQLYARIAEPYLSSADLKQWSDYFDPKSSTYILDRDDVYYGMLEVLTVGTV